jgi:hypothetical protein
VTASGDSPDSAADVTAAFRARCDAIEEAYEFFLAYASQGLPSDHGNDTGRQAREFLRRCDRALEGLGELLTQSVNRLGEGAAAPYHAFIRVIDRDARDAQAAVQLVAAQASIGSGVIDNLYASIHLRALLTDLFLIDEVLKNR